MELANVLLAIGGDRATSIPKYNVTPAEIAVLCAIHGSDAVFDIAPTGETVNRSFRDERDRLLRHYPATDEDRRSIVLNVYPGTNPVLHTALADLGLDEMFFKAEERVRPAPVKRAKAKPAAKPAPIAENIDNDATSMFEDDGESVME